MLVGDGPAEVVAFAQTLRRARTEDWECEGNQPVPPSQGPASPGASAPAPEARGSAPTVAEDVPDEDVVPDNVVPLRARAAVAPEAPGLAPSETDGGGLLGAGRKRFGGLDARVEPLATFEGLAHWADRELRATNARNKSTPRQPRTIAGARDGIGFADEYFRHRSVDDGPGRSRELHGDDAISDDDCIDLLTHWHLTNLRTRSTNETSLRDWAGQVARMSSGQVAPAAPVLVEEVVGARTVQVMAKQVRAVFELAETEGRVERSPWSARVQRRVSSAPVTHFSDRALPSEAATVAAIDALLVLERTVIVGSQRTVVNGRTVLTGGTRIDVTGERYHAMVKLQERRHLRPDEVIALRVSSCRHLRDERPRLMVADAMVEVTLALSPDGTSIITVPLKARGAGEERPVELTREEADFVLAHKERFVPEPDPTSDDPDVRDPLIFTTHDGGRIRLSHFQEHWWQPAVAAAAPPGHPELHDGLALRMLRHIGISRRILEGDSIDRIADEAGNTSEVIRRHYRGIIADADHAHAGAPGTPPAPASTAEALANVSVDGLPDELMSMSESEQVALRRKIGGIQAVLS